MKKPKRSQQKIITPTSKILRFMRMSRGISMREAGARNGISDSAINHYEQGRMNISSKRLQQLIGCYGYTMQEFEEYAVGKPLPVLRNCNKITE
ncbi:helix-turn-helix transcriptional regulator [Bdellovibrionota bacterium FG-2]